MAPLVPFGGSPVCLVGGMAPCGIANACSGVATNCTLCKCCLTIHVGSQFLAELGLKEDNPGNFNGSWGGSGESITTYSPATGKPLARVSTTTRDEYEATMTAMDEAFKIVRNVRHLTFLAASPRTCSRGVSCTGPCPCPWRDRAPDRQRCARPRGRTGCVGVSRDGQDQGRGCGRGAGVHRHLRLRCGPQPHHGWPGAAVRA